MNIREYKNSDYWTLASWWTAHNWACPHQEMLPKTGFIIEDVCAGFLYKTDSKIAFLEWIISNPKSNKEERNKALNILINQLCEDAKKSEFEAIFTSSNHNKLIERYKNHGFNLTDESVTHLIKRI